MRTGVSGADHRPMNSTFWNSLFEALGAWQGMSLLGPVPTRRY